VDFPRAPPYSLLFDLIAGAARLSKESFCPARLEPSVYQPPALLHAPSLLSLRCVFLPSMNDCKFTRLTSFFSIAAFRFSSLFFTLVEISHLFAYSYEKYPVVGPSHVPIPERHHSQLSLSLSTSLPRYLITSFRLFVRDSLIILTRSPLNETL